MTNVLEITLSITDSRNSVVYPFGRSLMVDLMTKKETTIMPSIVTKRTLPGE